MTRYPRSLSEDYFEKLYQSDPDPWKFATSEYEKQKYEATLASLPKHMYQSGLEIGCSVGIFTALLAARCDQFLALDVSSTALAQAAHRCANWPNVRFKKAFVPTDWPDGMFDLIILSEVLYYLDISDVAVLAARIENSVLNDGTIVLVHWLGPTNYPLTGDDAASLFIDLTSSFAKPTFKARTELYRLDVLQISRRCLLNDECLQAGRDERPRVL